MTGKGEHGWGHVPEHDAAVKDVENSSVDTTYRRSLPQLHGANFHEKNFASSLGVSDTGKPLANSEPRLTRGKFPARPSLSKPTRGRGEGICSTGIHIYPADAIHICVSCL